MFKDVNQRGIKIVNTFFLVLFVLICAFNVSNMYAQATATLRGKVIDSGTGEPMIGVNVLNREASVVTITDINGQYVLNGVPTGQQTIEFVMPGYQRSSAKLNVTPGAPNYLNISMTYQTVGELVVTAKRVSNTEAALLSKRKKAPVAQDAISAEQISKSPDSDAADAAKRVTGITIVNGDRVFVRGLGERYSSVQFAGSTLPSPNPEKRVVPLDVFPTGLIDNIVISKAWTPDMSGEFAGGVVEINPKDYPDKRIVKVSVGTGIHTSTKMNLFGTESWGTDFYTYNGGERDFIGYDDGSRALPDSVPDNKLDPSDTSKVEKVGQDFKNTYTPKQEDPNLPLSVGFTVGDSYKIGESSNVGFLVSGLFKEKSKNKEYELKQLDSQGELYRKYTKKQSTYSTTSGGLVSFGYTSKTQKVRATSVYSHISDDKTSRYKGYNEDRGNSDSRKYKLDYSEKTFWFNQLSGNHYIVNDIKAEWIASYALATLYQPDSREVEFYGPESDTAGSGSYITRPDYVSRSFLEHEDNVYEVKPALLFPFKQWNGLDSKFKIGGAWTYRNRESVARNFIWKGTQDMADEPVEDYFTNENIGGSYASDPLAIYEVDSASSRYKGALNIYAGFSQLDMPLWHKLRIVGGVRYENANMDLEYWDPVLVKYKDLDEEPLTPHNILPGASLTFAVTSDINIRSAFSRTVARPDFREIIEYGFQSQEHDGVYLLGNPKLKQTDINNYDFRTEWFPSSHEILAISTFYKHMDYPIELLALKKGGTGENFKYINSDYADLYGGELEIRKDFSFIAEAMKDFSFSTNLAYIISEIKIDDTSKQRYSSNKRPLQGQSPYVINLALNYDNEKSGTNISLPYNIYGRRIVAAGLETYEKSESIEGGSITRKEGDIYEEPVGKLDFVIKQKIFGNGSLKFTASNLLDPDIEWTQTIETKTVNSDGLITKGRDKTYSRSTHKDGRSYSVSVGYSF